MRYRQMFAPFVAVALVAAATACGPGPAEKAQSGDEVKLQMVESLTNPTRTTLLKKLIADFEAKNSGIKVQLISPPTNSADQKIQQMLQSGKGVDVLEVRDTTVGPFSTNKWIYDMAPDLKGWDGLQRADRERPQGHPAGRQVVHGALRLLRPVAVLPQGPGPAGRVQRAAEELGRDGRAGEEDQRPGEEPVRLLVPRRTRRRRQRGRGDLRRT